MVSFVVRDERAVYVIHHNVLVREGDLERIQGRDDERIDSDSERAERTSCGGGAGGQDNEDTEAREDHHRNHRACNQLLSPDSLETVVCLLPDHLMNPHGTQITEPARSVLHCDEIRRILYNVSPDARIGTSAGTGRDVLAPVINRYEYSDWLCSRRNCGR